MLIFSSNILDKYRYVGLVLFYKIDKNGPKENRNKMSV